MNYLFADTANLDEIKIANDMGVIQGVSTNPSIMANPAGPVPSIYIVNFYSSLLLLFDWHNMGKVFFL